MADSRLLDLEATEAEVLAKRQTLRGPSLARRSLALFGVLVAIAVVWEVVKVAFAVTDYNRAQFQLFTAMGRPSLEALPKATPTPVEVRVAPGPYKPSRPQ